MSDYPHFGKAIMRFKSPHSTDLSFEAGEVVRVISKAPEDDDWSLGESLDGARKGIFPKDFVEKTDIEPSAEDDKKDEEAPSPVQPAPLAAVVPPPASPSADTSTVKELEPTPELQEAAEIPTTKASSPLPPANSPPTSATPIAASEILSPIDVHVTETSPAPLVPSSIQVTPTVLTETPPISTRPSYNDPQLEPVSSPAAAVVEPVKQTSTPPFKPQAQETPSAVKVGGMSASDAQESITRGGGSLRDRMAAFQQKAAAPAPPPVPRGKPGNWAWKNKAATEGAGGTSPGAVSSTEAPAPSSSPAAPGSSLPSNPEPAVASTPSPSRPGTMSASDAKESITKSGGSLKERMAALQGAFGSASPPAGSPPPVPSGKPKVWKRPEAAAVSQSEIVEEKKKSKWVVEEHKTDDEEGGGVEKTGKALVVEEGEEEAAPADAVEENDQEVAERARRAAIAARMAKIGARGPMGMMKAPPVPPPIGRRDSSTDNPATTPEVERDEPKPSSFPVLDSTAETPSSPENSSTGTTAPLPAMPRRAAPPRRKPQKSTSSGATPTAVDEVSGDAGHPAPPNPSEIPVEKSEKEVKLEKKAEEDGKGKNGAKGAENAGIALAPAEPVQDETKEEPAGSAVPKDEDAQAELTKVDPAVQHKEKTLTVLEPDEHLVASPGQERSEPVAVPAVAEAGHHVRRTSIPLPARDASYHETDLEHREIKKGDVGSPIHSVAVLKDEPASRQPSTEPVKPVVEEDEDEEEHAPVVKEKKRLLPTIPVEDEQIKDSSPEGSPHLPPPRSLPPAPVTSPLDLAEETAGESTIEEEEGGMTEEDDENVEVEEEAPPPPLRRTSVVPPLPQVAAALAVDDEAESPATSDVEEADAKGSDIEEEDDTEGEATPPPLPPARRPSIPVGPRSPEPAARAPSLPYPSGQPAVPTGYNAEPLVAEEAPPPPSNLARRASIQMPSTPSLVDPEAVKEEEPSEQDEEATRRQTIAARMAKLGGANQMRMFGGPPPPVKKPSVSVPPPSSSDANSPVDEASKEADLVPVAVTKEPAALDEEENEEAADKARRARALAKMSAMGGQRIGMGFGAPMPPAPEPEPESEDEEDEAPASAPAPVEADEDEEAPPPPPPIRRPSVHTSVARALPQLPAEAASSLPPQPVVEEPSSFHDEPQQATSDDDAPPPPPPARPARSLPSVRTSLDTQRPPVINEDVVSPTSPARMSSMRRFSGLISRGHSRTSTDETRPSMDEVNRPSEQQLYQETSRTEPPIEEGRESVGAQELIELSRTVGSAVARNAESLVGQSKKAVVADGTSLGFVSETLYMSRCQAPASPTSFGHLIFHQSTQSLLSRRDDIRPGDILTLTFASFKGKKGLTSYSEHVDSGVGIVLEFEGKKSKVRVAQAAGKANHYPTLEHVSYRLEDLKSGDVRVFRPVAA